jgi:hypothetical protein
LHPGIFDQPAKKDFFKRLYLLEIGTLSHYDFLPIGRASGMRISFSNF